MSRSRTVALDRDELRAALLDEDGRVDLFPGHPTAVRSRPGSRTVRLAIGPGVAEISLEPASGGRMKVTVAHERLATAEQADGWRFYWGEWLEALASA